MRRQQLQSVPTRDGAKDLVSPYLTAPPIVPLCLSLLLVEAIIRPPQSLPLAYLSIQFVSRVANKNQVGAIR